MRLFALIVTLAFFVDSVDAEDAPTALPTADSAERVLELAKRYQFFAAQDRQAEYQLHPMPLLTYSNPIRGDVHGNVFVWTLSGRPEVVAAIFDFRSESKFDSEFHVLSRAGTVGARDGAVFWQPAAAGVEFQVVPGAPSPARTPTERLRQMRSLAREFSVTRNHPEQGKEVLRQLPQPLFRYEPPTDNDTDGALFAFVEGTDPEAYLILETGGANRSEWHFAFARMNIVEFNGFHEGTKVWHVDPISWDTVFDRQEPYAIVRENPRRGLVRTR